MKWTQAKAANDGGDDWGDDDEYDYSPPITKPTSLQGQGQEFQNSANGYHPPLTEPISIQGHRQELQNSVNYYYPPITEPTSLQEQGLQNLADLEPLWVWDKNVHLAMRSGELSPEADEKQFQWHTYLFDDAESPDIDSVFHDFSGFSGFSHDDELFTITSPRTRYEFTIVNDQFSIGEFLRADNHAYVYFVYTNGQGSVNLKLEARVYCLGGLTPKMRRYRLRNMKRYSSRTLFQGSHGSGGDLVIVYATDSADTEAEDSGRDHEFVGSTSLQVDKAIDVVAGDGEQQRNIHSREKARIRQLERRRLNRRKRKEPGTIYGREEQFASGNDMTSNDTANETALVHASPPSGGSQRNNARENLAERSGSILEDFIFNPDITIGNDEESEETLKRVHRCVWEHQRKMLGVATRQTIRAQEEKREQGGAEERKKIQKDIHAATFYLEDSL